MSEASSRATTKASRLVSSAAPKPRPGPHRTIPLPPRRAPHSPRTRPLRPTPPPARRAQPEPHFGLRPAAERPLRAFPGQPPARRTRLAIKPARIRSRMFHKNLPRPQSPILLFQASGGVKKYEPDLEWKAGCSIPEKRLTWLAGVRPIRKERATRSALLCDSSRPLSLGRTQCGEPTAIPFRHK